MGRAGSRLHKILAQGMKINPPYQVRFEYIFKRQIVFKILNTLFIYFNYKFLALYRSICLQLYECKY